VENYLPSTYQMRHFQLTPALPKVRHFQNLLWLLALKPPKNYLLAFEYWLALNQNLKPKSAERQ